MTGHGRLKTSGEDERQAQEDLEVQEPGEAGGEDSYPLVVSTSRNGSVDGVEHGQDACEEDQVADSGVEL